MLTDRVAQLTNDYFVNLLALGTQWRPVGRSSETFEATVDGQPKWTGTRADLVFGFKFRTARASRGIRQQ